MTMTVRISIVAAVVCFASACDSGDPLAEDMGLRELLMSVDNLEPLPSGYHYEGWAQIIEDDIPKERSTGAFNVDADGRLVDLNGARVHAGIFETDFGLETAITFSVTVEPDGASDGLPSDTRLMGGDFRDLRATLVTSHELGIDLRLELGIATYILATPTNGPITDELSGLWFINTTPGVPARGLQVVYPLTGWNYQGWVVVDGIPLTTGVVLGEAAKDDSAPYSGALDGFDFPGEDFLVNPPPDLTFPLSLAGMPVFVTLEPSPDPDPGPSPLKYFVATVPSMAVDNFTYRMISNYANLPTGEVHINAN